MAILVKSRQILHFSGLGTDPNAKNVCKRILLALIRIAIPSFLFVSFILESYICQQNYERGWHQILFKFAIGISYLFSSFIYVSLLSHTNEITNLYIFLQQIVDKSKHRISRNIQMKSV